MPTHRRTFTRNIHGATRCALVAGTIIGLAPQSASWAQTAQPGAESEIAPDGLDVYENRIISEVYIRPAQVDGEDSLLSESAQQQAINNTRSQPGNVFDAETIRDDIRRLNRLGTFSRV